MQKIYVIENDGNNLELLKEVLEDHGYRVMAYETADPTYNQQIDQGRELTKNVSHKPQHINPKMTNIESLEDIITINSMRIKLGTREIMYEDIPIELTYKEYELLLYLINNKYRVVPREELLNQIWGYDYNRKSRTLDIHIQNLRKKLGLEAEKFIKTFRSVGYRFIEIKE